MGRIFLFFLKTISRLFFFANLLNFNKYLYLLSISFLKLNFLIFCNDNRSVFFIEKSLSLSEKNMETHN